MAHEFTEWPKTTRLFRDIVVTEKIDGTNAAVHVSALHESMAELSYYPADAYSCVVDGARYVVSAQSRRRLITPDSDNFWFARWVYDNAAQLVRLLGTGLHFGEWWGHGIQRGYGLTERRFSLFNTGRYTHLIAEHDPISLGGATLDTVPVLYEGIFSEEEITGALHSLRDTGSVAVPGWATPEGICVYHTASRSVSKVTLDHNDAGKWESA